MIVAALLALPLATQAAQPNLAGSLAQTIGVLTKPLESLPYPNLGTLGNVSLSVLPLLNSNLPLLGKGLPLVSTITVNDGVIIVQSISALQQPLPGLGGLNAVLSGLGAH
jgi:hypothetical protein